MESYANQRKITIGSKNEPQKGMEGNFVMIRNDVAFAALSNLKKSGFTLWLYLYSNKEGWEFWLSQQAFANSTGLCKSQYYRAFEELKEKGYITQTGSNKFTFTAEPFKPLFSQVEERRIFLNNDTGEDEALTYKQLLAALCGDKAATDELWEGSPIANSTFPATTSAATNALFKEEKRTFTNPSTGEELTLTYDEVLKRVGNNKEAADDIWEQGETA